MSIGDLTDGIKQTFRAEGLEAAQKRIAEVESDLFSEYLAIRPEPNANLFIADRADGKPHTEEEVFLAKYESWLLLNHRWLFRLKEEIDSSVRVLDSGRMWIAPNETVHFIIDTQPPPMDTRKRLSAHVLGQWYYTYGRDRLSEEAFKGWAVKTLLDPSGKPHTHKLIQEKIDRKDNLTTIRKPNKGRDKSIAWLSENVPCLKKSN